MNSRVYSRDSCSKMEALWNDLETTEIAFLATHYVNPIWDNLVGKTILITLPVKINLSRLTRFNKVISRYPLTSDKDLKYELVPYSDFNFESKKNNEYSKKILNKYLLTSDEHDIKEDTRFLLGTELETNGYLNTIGYLLLKQLKVKQDKSS